MKEILLIGGGGHCKSVIDVIEQQNTFRIAGIVDQHKNIGNTILDYEVIGSDDNLSELSKQYQYALITVGQITSPDLRIKLFHIAKKLGFIFPAIISPRAYVSKYSLVQEGTVIMHDALVNANVIIGKNCIINSKALIEHDSEIEDNCHISTGVIINGGVKVGRDSFVGSNATTKESISIKENSFNKAGGLVK